MARPQRYENRVDTKIRLRRDHVELLREAEEERGLSRNRLIELALDQFFGGHAKPRLRKTPKDPDLGSSATPGNKPRPRTRPRLHRVGEAFKGDGG